MKPARLQPLHVLKGQSIGPLVPAGYFAASPNLLASPRYPPACDLTKTGTAGNEGHERLLLRLSPGPRARQSGGTPCLVRTDCFPGSAVSIFLTCPSR